MDVTRTRARRSTKFWLLLGLTTALFSCLIVYVFTRQGTVRLDRDRLTISTVTEDRFYEYINLDGRVEPEASYVIDSKVAGNIARIFVESGQKVRRGDTLLLIANADLELEVMQRESQLIEQLNNQDQTRLLLNQNDFNRREQLVEINFQVALQEKQFRRDEELYRSGVIAASDYEPTANRYAYFQQRRQLLAASFRVDSMARSTQLAQITAFKTRLLYNLQQVRAILDRLYVLAPTDGRLSDFSVQGGQAITSGQRLGQVYSLEDPVIVAEVDEFYLDKVSVGQKGILPGRADSLPLVVEKIYPNVTAGRFRVDARIAATVAAPTGFVKGQSLRLRLFFGSARSSTVLANGGFYSSTGGHWVSRLTENGAERTPIRLGRANPNQYEVLDGLIPGDRVIVSAYDDFADYQTISLN